MITKLLLKTTCVVGGLLLCSLFVLGKRSQSMSSIGLVKGNLKPCDEKPSCICSSKNQTPLTYTENPIQKFRAISKMMGGHIVTEKNNYLAVEFVSGLFGFVDDLELLYDEERDVLHFRSASRVGYYDFGVNSRRLAELVTGIKKLSLED